VAACEPPQAAGTPGGDAHKSGTINQKAEALNTGGIPIRADKVQEYKPLHILPA